MIARPAKKMRLSDVPVKYVWLNCKSTPPPSPVRQGSGTKSSHVFGPIVILRRFFCLDGSRSWEMPRKVSVSQCQHALCDCRSFFLLDLASGGSHHCTSYNNHTRLRARLNRSRNDPGSDRSRNITSTCTP